METLRDYLKYEIDRGHNFAYTTDPKESLLHILKNESGLKKTRENAEREASENYRIKASSNDSADQLIAEGKIVVWDLKEELNELD